MAPPERVVLLNDFSTGRGGAGYLADALTRGLAQRGVPVTFVAGDGGRTDWREGVTQLALGQSALLDGNRAVQAMRGLRNRPAAARIGDWIARNDTGGTVYHLHNWSNIFSPSVFDALAPVARRVVVHAHDFFLACPNGMFLDFPRAEVCPRTALSPACLSTQCDKRNYAQKLWRSARHKRLTAALRPHLRQATFVAIHGAMRPRLRAAHRIERLTVIRNPVTPFGPTVTAPQAQRGIAHIGQVQRLKGVYDLAEAGRRLDATVDFFGTGEDLADLRARYPEHRYHGWTDRAGIAAAMARTRAVVVATQSPEPFCLSAFEAVATGLPLVVSDAILAAPELTRDGAALPFASGDVGSLTTALGRLLSNDRLVAALAAAARHSPVDQTLDSWVDAHAALYRSVLSPNPEREPTLVLS
ncbi:glycosyltransferase family 4 protein [Jannaschia marina]|uniref:glycosyltransferase family 4 protein n=1 Tax=Jannaschia marina TaxID=2741674 RepID=UPI0015CCEC9F|nr:glycosyltransferase family 4 protein [Jannaschia marina]